ncbi:hypothetical protein EJB05_24373, partial [Eragrostis curvula]
MAAASSTSPNTDDASSGGRTNLPLNITEKILRCISPLESAHLAAVCQPWATTVSARLAGPFAPHLFLLMPPEHKSDRSGLIVPVSLDGAVRPPAAIPARVRKADTLGLDCIGATPSGRVAFLPYLSSGIVFLVNPVTGVSRWIDMRMPKGGPKQVLASAAGACAGGGSGGVDALLSIYDNFSLVFSWRAAGAGCDDGVWNSSAVEKARPWLTSESIVSLARRNNFFYVLHEKGSVSVIDAGVPPPPRMDPVIILTGRGSGGDQLQQFATPLTNLSDARLVESDGEILLVRRLVEFKELAVPTCEHNRLDLVVVGFEVYRLDVEHRRWTKVEELADDQAIFVSPESSFAVRASQTAGCRSNCIYYVRKKRCCSLCNTDRGNTCWGVYSMEKQAVLFEHDLVETGSYEI